MKGIVYIGSFGIIAGSVVFILNSPDLLAAVIISAMLVFLVLALFFGVIPTVGYYEGLKESNKTIKDLQNSDNEIWEIISKRDSLFKHKKLDSYFNLYKEKVNHQRKTGQIISNIQLYINEDTIYQNTWQGMINLVPGTLTGLGILGTFIGLIIGISKIGFGNIGVALSSIEGLIEGIRLAFYTSIVGVILSIVFNIFQKFIWNLTYREISLFLINFTMVIPTVEEQKLYLDQRYRKTVIDRLNRIPKDFDGLVRQESQGKKFSTNERILLPQVASGLENNEFFIVLQPKYNIHSKQISSTEAFVRWNNKEMGIVSPGTFLPLLEENGYITRLDNYVWKSVFKMIKGWIDKGINVIPVALNISKTCILAQDCYEIIVNLAEEYNVLPRMIELEVSQRALLEARELTLTMINKFRKSGYKVIIDGFKGDYVRLELGEDLKIDEVKFDIRKLDMEKDKNYITSVINQGKSLSFDVSVEGIESMEQVVLLRKAGCTTGQGYYFSKPLTEEEYLNILKEGNT